MIFNEDNKVIIDSMNETEAGAFVKFLESEVLRHYGDIDDAIALIIEVSSKFNLRGNE